MNRIQISAFLIPLLSVSACSTTSTVNKLQSEYDNYKYSKYVSDNLNDSPKAQPHTVAVQEKPSLNDKKLKAFKHQLASRRRNSGNRLQNIIIQNGLYKPSSALQQQLSQLRKREQFESWLKNNSSLNAALAVALKSNLDIQSEHEQALASLAKYDQVGFLDDMLSQYAAFTKDISLTGSTQKHKKSVSAGFPFPGLLSLKSSIIDQAVESSRLQLKQTVQDVITDTRIAYYELQYLQQEIAITGQNIKLLKSLKEQIESTYSSNSAELSAILQADIEIAKNRNKLQAAKDKRHTQQARLNALLHLSPTYTLGKLDSLKAKKLSSEVLQLIVTGKARRVEITRLRTELEKMKQIIQLSEKRFYPDFDAGFSRFQNDKFTTKPKIKNSNFFAKNDAYLSETRQKYKALQSKIKALQNKTADDIQQAVSSYQTQKRTHALYRNKVLPKARTTLDIAKNLYETGEAPFVKVIKAQEMILNYRLLSLKAIKEANISAVKVKRFVGVDHS